MATGNRAWTLPVGARSRKLGACDNALRPDEGAAWQIRTQVTVIL